MCLIIEISQPSKQAERVIRSAAEYNPDGYGIAYWDGRGWHGMRGLHKGRPAPVLQAYHAFGKYATKDHPVIMHVRQATAGAISLKNCHPFSIGRALLFHNGHINIPQFFLRHGESDTACLVRMLAGYIYDGKGSLMPARLDKAIDQIGNSDRFLFCLPGGLTKKYGAFHQVEASISVSNFYAWNSSVLGSKTEKIFLPPYKMPEGYYKI